ncbi:MAG TPA: PqiC family protein [Casimicrobiaceae bacterium]|nr:PqiC family protein [Casimicrobiaceae bacterium]
MTPRARFAATAAALALLAGCAATPPSHFYTLSGPEAPRAAASALVVAVGPVTVPGVVDRPEVALTVGENEVWFDEFNRWASPLADAIAIATAQNLAADLNAPRVTTLGQAPTGGADFAVAIEVQRFESVQGSYALLDAVYSVRRSADGRTTLGRATVREAASDKSYEALAAAHSRAVARMSRDIAQALRGIAAQSATTPPAR